MTEKHYKGGSVFPPTKPKLLRIYSMRYCPYAQRTRLVLAHKNIPHETINIHLRDKPDWFWTKNPLGAVPVLEIDDKIVYESTATCEWLDDIHTQSHLQPTDPYRRAWDRILLEYFSKLTTAFYGLLFKSGEPDKQVEDLTKHLTFYDQQLAKRGGPFFGDKSPSLIDFYIWPHLERIQALGTRDQRILIDKARYPKLAEWVEAMNKVPAVKATSSDVQTTLHFFDSVEAGQPDFDYGL
uniref:Glutathione S-transferase omega n=1 Tax=Arion vulgaris TaxID=1028688 RepID=A0A0B6ZPN1_9EUPU